MSNTVLVVHHSADFDGICSREVARKALGDSADYLGWDYGQPIPDLTPYTTVYLIDISLPREVMTENAAKLIWIDHHISKIREMEGVEIPGYRIDGVAACRLAWQWFFGDPMAKKDDYREIDNHPSRVTEPYAVRLLGMYDVWDKSDASVDPFQLGILAEKSPQWDVLLVIAPERVIENREYIVRLVENGKVIQRFTEVTNAQISQERGFDVVFEGRTFRALNIARCNSLTFTASIKPHHEGCLAYYWNGCKWRFSLYHADHRKDIDLSVIAAKHGGGGHRGACGFELEYLPAELGGGGVLC